MGSGGLIVAFLVALWAAYFVPLVMRRYDEASKDSALDAPGPMSRVVAQRTAAPVTVERKVQAPPHVPSGPAAAPSPVGGGRSVGRAAAIAAQRRRRTLLVLVGLLTIVTGVALGGLIPLWSISVPVAFIVAWLFACRIQVRAERGMSTLVSLSILSKISVPKFALPREVKTRTAERARSTWHSIIAGAVGSHASNADNEDTLIVSVDDAEPNVDHVMTENAPLAASDLEEQLQIAVPSVSVTGEALWDPLPVTVPTYVTKPRVGRSVRTIDFTAGGAWTSGHVEGENVDYPRRDEGPDQAEAVGH